MGIQVQPNCCPKWQLLVARRVSGTTEQPSLWDIDINTGTISHQRLIDDGSSNLLPAGFRKSPDDGKVYMWENSGGVAAARLFRLRIGDGNATLIGSFGGSMDVAEGDLAIADDGTAYACYKFYTTLGPTTFHRALLTVDTSTGAATAVGDMKATTVSTDEVDYNGLDFHPDTGVLWCLGARGTPQKYYALTVDTGTGAATEVGVVSPDLLSTGAGGMAFDLDGKLYFAHGGGSVTHALYLFDDIASSQAPTLVANLSAGLDSNDFISGLIRATH